METQIFSETLNEGSVVYRPVQCDNTDGKTLKEVSVPSCLSESCGAGSDLAKEVQLSECYGSENAVVHNELANRDENIELEGVERERKLVGGQGIVESEKKLENLEDNNGLKGVETELKLADELRVAESERKLANVDDSNSLVGVDIENEFGDVDDGIDLEALGLENETIAFDNMMEEGNLEHETQPMGTIIPDANTINDTAVVVSELDAEVNEPKVNTVEKAGMVDAAGTIGNSNVHGNNSPRKIDVSGDGISLFVEVFGPLNGIYQDAEMLANGGSDCMVSMKDSGVNGNEAEGDAGDYQEHNFAMGDLVWVKIKSPLWWPGMICDPTASKDAGKCDQRGRFFVKYFGNTNSAWYQPFQLKPFLEYFEQMSRQNKSRSFYGAIEKALGEIGRRVKQKMTCSCFLKQNQVATQSTPSKDNKDAHSIFLPSQFETLDFLKFIRLRALDLHSPGGIEFTVMESCLSAFYYSIGHKQLPLYKLRPTGIAKDEDMKKLSSGDSVLKSCKSDPDDCKTFEVKMSGSLESPKGTVISCSEGLNENTGGKSEKGFESRERKKSKYLSYPYVNSWSRKNSIGQGGDETEDNEERVKSPSSPSMVSTPIGNCSNRNSLRKSRKSVMVNDVCSTADIIAASSAEMLQELCLTALDCFFPSQSTSSVPIQQFYLRFRIFRNPEVEIQMDEDKVAAVECQETYESSLGANTSDNGLASGGYNLQVNDHHPAGVLPKKRGRKKRDDCTSIDGSAVVDTVDRGTDTVKKGTVNRKRKEVATAAAVLPKVGVLGGLPDLNGSNAGLSVENMQVIGPAPTQGKLEPKRRKRKKEENVSEVSMQDAGKSNTQFVQLLQSVQVAGPGSLEGSPLPNNPLGVRSLGLQGTPLPLNVDILAGQQSASESHVSASLQPNNSQIMGQLSSVKAEGKKRKRKEKASNIQYSSSALPDLNGHSTESNVMGKDSAELSAVTSQGKPKRRRRRTTKSAIAISAPGANTLLLDFQMGSSVPSKEYITATFSRFGPLLESKTEFLNDSTAQVVFVNDGDAIEALQSLQSRNPFGPSLASYRIQHASTSNNMQAPHSFLPTDVLMNPAALSGAVPSNGEGPDLVVIKQNLEAMTTMLDKAGDNISPEMRAKLENEVKGFLKKVSCMVGSSST